MRITFPSTMGAPERYTLGYEHAQRDAKADRDENAGSTDRSYSTGYTHGYADCS